MKNTIVIDCSENFYRVAVLEKGRLIEVIVEKKAGMSLVGNIYKGVVTNILPSHFVFVNIGECRNAFLFLDDNKEKGLSKLKRNQDITVQVTKDASGEKGAYLTTQLNFSGRYSVLVIQNGNEHFSAVSKKITHPEERLRLQTVADYVRHRGYSVILRTNCEGVAADVITDEIDRNIELYESIVKKADYVKAPQKLFYEENPLYKVVRDLLNRDTEAVVVNDEESFLDLKAYAGGIQPGTENLFVLYEEERNIFDRFNVNKQIEKALQKRIWLKSGAFLFIERTEALSVIDVNSGKFEGRADSEKSKFEVNKEAAEEIARQIRLRNLSGIILVDFIDMKSAEHKREIIEQMRTFTATDRMSVNIVGITELGFMEMTRKKGREPLQSILLEDCPKCGGSGTIGKF